MKDDNSKVPVAVLSCFLIAFILQGALKLCGVLVFEKALDWQIFTVIDNHKWLQVIYHSLLNCVCVYCLSFALSQKPYSRKIGHYILIVSISFGVTCFRLFATYTAQVNILLDILVYVVVPFVINITIDYDKNPFGCNSVFSIVVTLSINIFLYFAYLGLTYWSLLLNSLLPNNSLWVMSSTNFLVNFEVYIALIILMLSMNVLMIKIKENTNMIMPQNIASKKAKLTAKKEVLEKKLAKINAEIAELEAKENAK